MLVLTRKEGEKLVIGENVVITVNRIAGNRVAIGIEAPREVSIVREELAPRESVGSARQQRGVAPNSAVLDSDIAVAGQMDR